MWSAVLVDTRPEGVDGMPRPKEFTVTLSAGDRAKLTTVVSSGRHPARMITRASNTLARGIIRAGCRPDETTVVSFARSPALKVTVNSFGRGTPSTPSGRVSTRTADHTYQSN